MFRTPYSRFARSSVRFMCSSLFLSTLDVTDLKKSDSLTSTCSILASLMFCGFKMGFLTAEDLSCALCSFDWFFNLIWAEMKVYSEW